MTHQLSIIEILANRDELNITSNRRTVLDLDVVRLLARLFIHPLLLDI
jgi:hypothetical protein